MKEHYDENDFGTNSPNRLAIKLIIYCFLSLAVTLFGIKLYDDYTISSRHKENTPDRTPIESSVKGLDAKYQGVYRGMLNSYNMKDEYGKEVAINGNKVTVPPSGFRFEFLGDGTATLILSEISDVSEYQRKDMRTEASKVVILSDPMYYYRGTYTIKSEDSDFVELECDVSLVGENHPSNVNYHFKLDKIDETGYCKGHNQPSFYMRHIRR